MTEFVFGPMPNIRSTLKDRLKHCCTCDVRGAIAMRLEASRRAVTGRFYA